MSYEAHVTDTTYCYDGSFAGFLVLRVRELRPEGDPRRGLPARGGTAEFLRHAADFLPTSSTRGGSRQGWTGLAAR